MDALERAIDLCGVSGLAKVCGVSPQAVHKWRANGVPPERVLDIERATRDPKTETARVTRHDLRPDLYPEGA
jgi:DNA-binding transcriptional regulator YdaS (Cro superfamily)